MAFIDVDGTAVTTKPAPKPAASGGGASTSTTASTTSSSGGSTNLPSFFVKLAYKLGVDPNAPHYQAFMARWVRGEGTTARHNPLATTQDMPGATAFNWNNGFPVKNYPDEDTGVEATYRTLTNGYYPTIVQYLRTGQGDPVQMAKEMRTWGTTNFADELAQGILPSGGTISYTPSSGSSGGSSSSGSAIDTSSWSGRAALMEQVLDYITSNPPKRSDYATAEEFSAALAVWQESVSNAAAMVQNFQQAAMGLFQAPDGTLIPYTQMTPEQKAFVDTVNENLWRKAMNDFQLQNYQLQRDRIQTELGNATNRFNSLLALDQARISQANSEISRMLGGLAESRQRANYVTNTQLAAAPWASPDGKTSFTAGDLGGAIGERWAQMMGIDPTAPILNYTGTMQIDPVGLMNQFDTQLGVTGQLPNVPSLLTTLDDVPANPTLPPPPILMPPIQMPTAPVVSPGTGNVPSILDLFGPEPYDGTFQLNPNWVFDPSSGSIIVPNSPTPLPVDPSLINPNAVSTPHTVGTGLGINGQEPLTWGTILNPMFNFFSTKFGL